MDLPPELFGLLPGEREHARALHVDTRIARAAHVRDGIVTRRQLLLLGVSSSAIGRRVDRELLHPVHHGVFVVGHARPGREGPLRAALVAHGPTAVLSHATAAARHQLTAPGGRIDVTVTGHRAAVRAGASIRLHLTRRLDPEELVLLDGLPVTSVARTLADTAADDPGRSLPKAWDRADALMLIDVGAIDHQLRRGRAGAAALRALSARRAAPASTESDLEDAFLALCATYGLPAPRCQWPLGSEGRSARADFVFPGSSLAVEVDGRAWHAVQAAFELDREKDLQLREAGFDPHRYTHRQVHREAERVAAALRRALVLRSGRAPSR